MKKIISFFIILLMLASICLPSYAFGDTVTTKAESTQETSATREGYEEDMVRGYGHNSAREYLHSDRVRFYCLRHGDDTKGARRRTVKSPFFLTRRDYVW